MLKNLLGITTETPATTTLNNTLPSSQSSNGGSTKRKIGEDNGGVPMETSEPAASSNKKPSVEVKLESEDEKSTSFNYSDEFEDEEEEEESEFMRNLKVEAQMNEEKMENERIQMAKKSAAERQNNQSEVKYILDEQIHNGEEVAYIMWRTSAIQEFTKKELDWRLAYFNFPETLISLGEQFPTSPGEKKPYQFLLNMMENKTNPKYNFKSCQMVVKFNPNMSIQQYKKVKKQIIKYINTAPKADNAPEKTVVLDLRKHELTNEEFDVIKYLASIHKTRLKTDEELKNDKKA